MPEETTTPFWTTTDMLLGDCPPLGNVALAGQVIDIADEHPDVRAGRPLPGPISLT